MNDEHYDQVLTADDTAKIVFIDVPIGSIKKIEMNIPLYTEVEINGKQTFNEDDLEILPAIMCIGKRMFDELNELNSRLGPLSSRAKILINTLKEQKETKNGR